MTRPRVHRNDSDSELLLVVVRGEEHVGVYLTTCWYGGRARTAWLVTDYVGQSEQLICPTLRAARREGRSMLRKARTHPRETGPLGARPYAPPGERPFRLT